MININNSVIYKFTLFLFFILFSSCKETIVDPNNNTLTSQEWEQISTDMTLISKSADSLLLLPDPVEKWNSNLSNYELLPSIEKAFINGKTLWIKFKKAGLIFWADKFKTTNFNINTNSSKENNLNSEESIIIGNKKACIINPWFNDENVSYLRNDNTRLENRLIQKGFNVTTKNGTNADLRFYGDSLKKYGLIYNIGHGGFGSEIDPHLSHTFIQTGEVGTRQDIIFPGRYYFDWVLQKMVLGHEVERRNGNEVLISTYSVSENFFNDEYSPGDFQNSFIYLFNCETFKSPNDELANVFNQKGVAVTVGWDESHWFGPSFREQGIKLIDTMLSKGCDLNTAISLLANDQSFETGDGGGNPPAIIYSYLTFQTWNNITSHLTFYPITSGNIQILNSQAANWDISEIHPSLGWVQETQIGNGRNDGISRIYIANPSNAKVDEFTWLGNNWTRVEVASFSDKVRDIAIGAAHNDGVNRIYSTDETMTLNEMTYNGTGWSKNSVGTCEALGVTMGKVKNDGIIRIYSSAENFVQAIYEYEWTSNHWQKTTINAGSSFFYKPEVGFGRNDNYLRVYAPNNDGHVYEFSWTGSKWVVTDVGRGNDYMWDITIGNGRNDGVNRIYGGNRDGHVYEFTWNGSTWIKSADLVPDNTMVIREVTVGKGRNDSINRLYCVGESSGLTEFSWMGSAWSRSSIDNLPTDGLVIGDARNDGTLRVYVENYPSLVEYSYSSSGKKYTFNKANNFNTNHKSVNSEF